MSVLELVLSIDRKQHDSLGITTILDDLNRRGFIDSVILPSGTVLWLITNDGKEHMQLTDEEKKEQSGILNALERFKDVAAHRPGESDNTTPVAESASTAIQRDTRPVDVIFKYRPESDETHEEANPIIWRIPFEKLFPAQSFEKMKELHDALDDFISEIEDHVDSD